MRLLIRFHAMHIFAFCLGFLLQTERKRKGKAYIIFDESGKQLTKIIWALLDKHRLVTFICTSDYPVHLTCSCEVRDSL